jgi:hypothetical protein
LWKWGTLLKIETYFAAPSIFSMALESLKYIPPIAAQSPLSKSHTRELDGTQSSLAPLSTFSHALPSAMPVPTPLPLGHVSLIVLSIALSIALSIISFCLPSSCFRTLCPLCPPPFDAPGPLRDAKPQGHPFSAVWA